MQNKFKAVIFYENQEKLDNYLSRFHFDEPIRIYKNNIDHLTYFDYEHFEIKCYNKFPSLNVRGIKCDFIAIEKSLTDNEMWNEFIKTTKPSMLVMQRFPIDVQIFE